MVEKERRAALIEISGELLVEMLRSYEDGVTYRDGTVLESVGDKIPKDAEVRGMSIGQDLTSVVVRIESPGLPPVAPGAFVDKLKLQLRQTAPPVPTKMEGVEVPETQVAAGLGFSSVAEMRRWQTDEGQRSSALEQKLRTTAGDAQHFRYGLVRALEVLRRIKDGSLADPELVKLAIGVVAGGDVDWDKKLPWLNEIPASKWWYPNAGEPLPSVEERLLQACGRVSRGEFAEPPPDLDADAKFAESIPDEVDDEQSAAPTGADIIGGFWKKSPDCAGCDNPLTIENAWMTDGCPCNSELGINSMNETRWRLLLELCHEQSRRIETLAAENDNLRPHCRAFAEQSVEILRALGIDALHCPVEAIKKLTAERDQLSNDVGREKHHRDEWMKEWREMEIKHRELKSVFDHAVECVDKVFQSGPGRVAMLSRFCIENGKTDKFEAVVTLAEEYLRVLNELGKLKSELAAAKKPNPVEWTAPASFPDGEYRVRLKNKDMEWEVTDQAEWTYCPSKYRDWTDPPQSGTYRVENGKGRLVP